MWHSLTFLSSCCSESLFLYMSDVHGTFNINVCLDPGLSHQPFSGGDNGSPPWFSVQAHHRAVCSVWFCLHCSPMTVQPSTSLTRIQSLQMIQLQWVWFGPVSRGCPVSLMQVQMWEHTLLIGCGAATTLDQQMMTVPINIGPPIKDSATIPPVGQLLWSWPLCLLVSLFEDCFGQIWSLLFCWPTLFC